MAIEILFKNEEFIFVNKPYDMYVNSDDANEKNTVACAVGVSDSHRRRSRLPLRFVQRLDYATSGALCLARGKAAAAQACRLLEARLAHKYYLAVVHGHVAVPAAHIQYAVGEDKSTQETSHKMVALSNADANCMQPRSADTRLLLLEKGYYDGEPVSVVLLKPITGRRHQLRVHCHAMGHGVLGDYTYGDGRDRTPHRMFLHARRLVLPLEGAPLDIETIEPFFSDVAFRDKWTTHTLLHPYITCREFRICCDVAKSMDISNVENCQQYCL